MTALITTTSQWRPLFWEPVAGTGERLMVGLVYQYSNQWKTSRILRDDVLSSLYGSSSAGARKLIDFGLTMFQASAAAEESLEQLGITLAGLHAGDLRHTAVASEPELLRVAALLYSSLAHIDKLDEEEAADTPTNSDVSRRFTTEIRELVTARHPALARNFSRTLQIVNGGRETRFGYAGDRLLAQFSVLFPLRAGASINDARARLFTLEQGNLRAGLDQVALISSTPREDDPLLGESQRKRNRTMQDEIRVEAESVGVDFRVVHSAQEAASVLLELEGA